MKNHNSLFALFLVLIGMCLAINQSNAQNDPQYTQFMFNKVGYNPAFAGNDQILKVATIYRKQWNGIEGAPTTMNLHAHMPFAKDRCGAGLSITSERIGYYNTTFAELSYAYRIPIGDNYLSIGLNGRMERGVSDQTQATVNDINDNLLITTEPSETFAPNFGVGFLFSGNKFFVGFSRPQMLNNGSYQNIELDDVKGYRLKTNYLMGGITLPISSKIKFQPTFLISYLPNAPTGIDVNAGFTFFDALFAGLSYRLEDSADILVGYQISKQLRLGAAYDFTLSELNQYTSGSFEFTLQYLFDFDEGGVQNIRFF